jgi:hypothetical protein
VGYFHARVRPFYGGKQSHNPTRGSDKEGMERRKETRLKANQPVIVSSFGLMKMPPSVGRTVDMSGSGLRLRLPNPIPCGSPVKVEAKHLVMLGEVCRCQFEDGCYTVSVMMLQSGPIGRTAS